METAVATVLGIIGAIIATIAGNHLYEKKVRDRISVRQIKGPLDKDVDSFIELYCRLFHNKASDYSEEDLRDWLYQQGLPVEHRPIKVEDFFLIAKYHGEVVGFLLCGYYPERKMAIIPYYGVKHDSPGTVRQQATLCLRKKLWTLLRRRDCNFLFFDLERPFSNLPAGERKERLGRIKLFKRDADQLGLKAVSLDFDYQTPRITLAPGTRTTRLVLMVVPIRGRIGSTLSRQQVLSFLRFIYLDCYGDIYELSDPRYASYHAHLAQRLVHYEKTLPESIGVG